MDTKLPRSQAISQCPSTFWNEKSQIHLNISQCKFIDSVSHKTLIKDLSKNQLANVNLSLKAQKKFLGIRRLISLHSDSLRYRYSTCTSTCNDRSCLVEINIAHLKGKDVQHFQIQISCIKTLHRKYESVSSGFKNSFMTNTISEKNNTFN